MIAWMNPAVFRTFPSAEADCLLKPSSRYNLDLRPQLLLCAGPMVDVLRTSAVA